MLRSNSSRCAVRPTKYYRALNLPTGHIVCFSSRVYYLIHRLQREIKSHELYDRPKTCKCSTNTKPCKTMLCNRGVDNALRPKFFQQPFSYLIRALILRNLFSKDKYVFIP